MAFSMFLRHSSTKLNGCPSRLLGQQLIRCNTTLASATTLRMLSPMQSSVGNLLNKHQMQSVIPQMSYATMAPAPAAKENKISLWIAERIVAASLIVTLPLCIAMPSKIVDVMVAVTMVAHTYWGFEALVQEYMRPLLFGNLVPKIAHVFVILLMMLTLGGLFYLIFDDIGIGGTIRKLWALKSKSE